MSKPMYHTTIKRQKGVATLLIAMMLMMGTTVMTFSVARTGLMESRMSNNEYRSKEVNQAAEAGLEYGVAWLSENIATWATNPNGVDVATPDNLAPPITAGNSDTYNAVVTFTRDPTFKSFILVTSTAASASDASITATMSEYVAQDSGPLAPGFDGPPMIINGCLSDVGGTPDIYPEGNKGPGPYGDSIATSKPAIVAGQPCISLGKNNNDHLDLHGGSIEYQAFSGSAWDYMFSKSRAEIKAMADAEVAMGTPHDERRYVWETTGEGDPYHTAWGSTTNPVILVFENCPKINGGTTIYGVVFVDGGCPGANGFGGAIIYGSMAVDGDINKLNANVEFHHFSDAEGSPDLVYPPDSAPKILGTWADF